MDAVPIRLEFSVEPADGRQAPASLAALVNNPDCTIVVRQDGVAEPARWKVTAQDAQILGASVPAVRDASIQSTAADQLGTCLRQAFGTLPLFDAGSEVPIELTAPEHPWLLTDVPWEFASEPPAPGRNAPGNRLGWWPVVRCVDAPVNVAGESARPRLLVAISNHESIPQAPIRPREFLPRITELLRRTPPFFVAAELGADAGDELTWQEFSTTLRQVKPNVLVVVAHGRTKAVPNVAFGDGNPSGVVWKDVTELAQMVAVLGTVRLVVMLSCDLVYGGNTGISGARSFVERGIPEVIAMQGKIPMDDAGGFVAQALVELFHRGRVSLAVPPGRTEMTGLFALAPAAFQARHAASQGRYWQDVAAAYRAGIAALVPVVPDGIVRPALCEQIAALLGGSGVTVVRAPYHSTGGAALTPIADAVARGLVRAHERYPPRVVALVDLFASGGPGSSDAPVWNRIIDALYAVFERIRVLLPTEIASTAPRPGDPVEAAALLLKLIDGNGVCVVVNGAGARDAQERSFWQHVGALARNGLVTRGALVVVPAYAAGSEIATALGKVQLGKVGIETIEPLSPDEIRTLLEPALQVLSATPGTLFALTGGSPSVLQAVEVAAASDDASADTILAALRQSSASDAQTIAQLLTATALDAQLPDLLALSYARFPVPAQEAIATFLGGDAVLAQRLVRAGLVNRIERAEPRTERKIAWFWVSKEMAQAVSPLVLTRSNGAYATAMAQLINRLGKKAGVDDAAGRAGGAELLFAVQSLLHDAAAAGVGKAANFAILIGLAAKRGEARSGAVSRRVVLAMLEVSAALAERDDPEGLPYLLLQVAESAQSLLAYGRFDVAMKKLETLAETKALIPEFEAFRLRLEANSLKDRKQKAGVDEALVKLEQARTIIEAASKDPANANSDGLAIERREIGYATMKLLQFFRGEAVDELPGFRELVDDAQDPISSAVALCTWAEFEMSRPVDVARWDRIDTWLHRADADLAKPGGPQNLRAYCVYQIAQAAWKRPDRKTGVARDRYREAQQLANDAGDWAREALALRRLAEIGLAVPGAGVDLGAVRQRIVELIAGRPSALDALGARALDRLHRAMASLTGDEPEKANHYRDAAAICAQPLLASRTDSVRLAEAAYCYLDLRLRRDDSFTVIHGFLVEIEPALRERLKITADLDDPPAVRAALATFLAAAGSAVIG